jgi:thiopurine S-methyltransferase
MEHDFWHQRWRDNAIGFHQPEINVHLKNYWSQLGVKTGAPVFVPLCGKSGDMLWLAEQHPVLGVELSPKAVEDFFAENALQAERYHDGGFSVCTAKGVTLYCGDFFALQPCMLQSVAAVYDRAALIALPPPMRQAYADKLNQLLAVGAAMLLVTLEYEQTEQDGPPFSVEQREVQRLFAANWRIESLCCEDILDRAPKYRERGLSRLAEHVYLLVKQ